MHRHEWVRVEAPVDCLLEYVQGPIGVAAKAEGLGEMELVVGIERRDIDRREPFQSGLLPALEPVEEREKLARVGHVGPDLAEEGRMPRGLGEPAQGGAGVTNAPAEDEALRIELQAALKVRERFVEPADEPPSRAREHPGDGGKRV